jgi:DNA-binding transcriptional regulator GbsR (MarR family)
MYKFNEILELFGLSYNINIDDIKRVKNTVLKTHPDKSGLPSEYFLFYKKAFDIIVQYFNETQKTSQIVPQKNPVYETSSISNNNKSIDKQINQSLNKMDKKDFSQKFNELFEKNMQTQIDPNKNEWFTNETPVYNVPKANSSAGIARAIDQIKETTSAMTKYRGVEELTIRSTGTSLYEDEENDDYVSCDPFSKLKFDDLRKVHKDQTVFAVKESDIQKRQQYKSYDDLNKVRNSMDLTPLEKENAERILREKETQKREFILAKQHESNLKTMEYSKKNQSIVSSFLRLT